MRRMIGFVLLMAMLTAMSACRNTYATGGTSSGGGGNGMIHSGIPF